MDGLGGGLTNYQNGLPNLPGAPEYGGGVIGDPGMGVGHNPSPFGAGGAFGAQAQTPKYFPDAGSAAIDYAKNRKIDTLNQDPTTGEFSQSGIYKEVAPDIRKPSYRDALQQGGDSAFNPALSKGGKLVAFLSSLAKGAAAGSAGGSFGGGFLTAAQMQRQEKQDQENLMLRKIAQARQAQQDQLNQQNIQSEIEYRKAQMALAGRRAPTAEEQLAGKITAAKQAGLQPGSVEYNKLVFDINPDHKSQTEWDAYIQKAGGDPVKALQLKNADAVSRSAAIGAGAEDRRAAREDAAGNAESSAAVFMQKAGGDPDKALALFDKAASLVTDPKDKRQLKSVREAIRGRRRVNPANPLDVLNLGAAQAQDQTQ